MALPARLPGGQSGLACLENRRGVSCSWGDRCQSHEGQVLEMDSGLGVAHDGDDGKSSRIRRRPNTIIIYTTAYSRRVLLVAYTDTVSSRIGRLHQQGVLTLPGSRYSTVHDVRTYVHFPSPFVVYTFEHDTHDCDTARENPWMKIWMCSNCYRISPTTSTSTSVPWPF